MPILALSVGPGGGDIGTGGAAVLIRKRVIREARRSEYGTDRAAARPDRPAGARLLGAGGGLRHRDAPPLSTRRPDAMLLRIAPLGRRRPGRERADHQYQSGTSRLASKQLLGHETP